jgi:hypothetical protein
MGRHAFLASSDLQQFSISVHIPDGIEIVFGKRNVKIWSMRIPFRIGRIWDTPNIKPSNMRGSGRPTTTKSRWEKGRLPCLPIMETNSWTETKILLLKT